MGLGDRRAVLARGGQRRVNGRTALPVAIRGFSFVESVFGDDRLTQNDVHLNIPSGLFIAGDERFFTFTQSFDLPPR